MASAFVWKLPEVHGLHHLSPLLHLREQMPTIRPQQPGAYPTQSGTTQSCGKYYQVVSGDDCATVDLRFGINFTQLQSLNSYLNTNCSNLWLQYDICVAPVSTPTVSIDGFCGVGVTCTGSGFGK